MLEELIPYYPDLSKNDSQKIFHGLAEIYSLTASKEIEPRVKPGEYYKHQRVVGRSMVYNDRLLIMSDPGTGKTCTFVVSDEMLMADTNLFKKFIFVTPPNLEESTKNQIICKCTDNKYINDSLVTKSELRRSGKKSFKSTYTMLSYDQLFKMVKGKTVKELNEEFDYSMFNVDEVTNLITLQLVDSVRENKEYIEWRETVRNEIQILSKITDLDHHSIINSEIQYVQYWRLFHAIRNSKVIFASGTIISNRAAEFFLIANILLPIDRQFNVNEFASNVFTYNLAKYAPYLNGLISYVKSSNVVAKPKYIGHKLNKKYRVQYPLDETSETPTIGIKEYDSKLTLYKVELHGYQLEKFYDNRQQIENEKISSLTPQYICIVNKKHETGRNASNDGETLNEIAMRGLDGLYYRQNTCSVFTEIVRIEKFALENAMKSGLPGPGVCFNYLELTETVLEVMKMLFRVYGFEVLDKPQDFQFLNESGGDYCNVSTITYRGLSKKPRAVFLTGGDTHAKIRTMVTQLASSEDNIHGEYIQFINGSEVMGVGVNVGNAKRFIRPIPEWNEAKDRQSRDRVFREDSHDRLREIEVKKRAAATGIKPGLYDFDIFVDVYNMCAFCRFFYLNRSYVKYFPDDAIFRRNRNGQLIIHPEFGLMIDPFKTNHIVGFCRKGEADKINNHLVSEYVIPGDNLIEKLKGSTINISNDINNIFNFEMDIVTCRSGVFSVNEVTPEFYEFITNNAFIYYDDFNFMQNHQNGDSFECNILTYKDGKIKKVNCLMEYYSPSEKQFIQMEEKSFASKRVIRYAKQIALDCLVNHERNYDLKNENYSLECDYDVCNYTCSSNILPGKSTDSKIYENNQLFWSNYEILYGSLIIDECKNYIISLLHQKAVVTISEIFDFLIPKYHRNYFINMAIYELLISKKKIINNFGNICYIASTKDSIYLSEEFPRMIKNRVQNIGNYNNKLIAVRSNPDYSYYLNSDDELITEIENIVVDPNVENYYAILEKEIIERITKFKVPTFSSMKLIEKCFGRIAYSILVDPQYQNPIFQRKDVDSVLVNKIFPIRCFETIYNGSQVFFHSQSPTKSPNEQGEISRIIKPNFFKVFKLKNINGTITPAWEVANKDEIKVFSQVTSAGINSNILNLKTREVPVFDEHGNMRFETFVSNYYISYYDGKYRLVSGINHGQKLDSIRTLSIISIIQWMKTSPLYNITENHKLIDDLEKYITAKSKERNKKLVNLFRANNLIFYFTPKTSEDDKSETI